MKSNEFTFDKNTFFKTVKDDAGDRISVEIGDSKQPDFKPQVKIERWDNEVNFSMRAEVYPNAEVTRVSDVIKYITPDYEVHQYEKPEIAEDGGFEFEWLLRKKPENNVLTATIQSKELDFFYQPALTQEEVDDGAARPENVVGSYAAYHKAKKHNRVGGKEYKTGKAFHVYRPEAIDGNGSRVWCDLHIDEENGILTVTVPQDFLNKAVYPIIVDPTFGYTSIGGSSASASDFMVAQRETISENGDLTKITAYLDTPDTTAGWNGVVYVDSSEALVAEGTGATDITTTPAWIDRTMAASLSSGVKYALCAWGGVDGSNRMRFFFDFGGSATYKEKTSIAYTNGSSAPDPMNSTDNGNNIPSIYATYDVAASSVEIQKSLKYTVIDTPTAITKSLQYLITTSPSAITKSLQYAVTAADSITKGLIYSVSSTVSAITKSLQYEIAVSPVITKSLKYTVLKSTSITKSLKYSIPGVVTTISSSVTSLVFKDRKTTLK